MSEDPGLEEQSPAAETADATARGSVRLKGTQSLERLRDRVRQAARELARLRQENATLHDRLAALESRPAVDPDATAVLGFDEDPEALRAKIEGFIEAIDAYLEQEAA